MTEQERQAAERNAIVNFMGTVFGEAKKIDREMIQQSSTLQPTSHVAEQALRSYLQTQAPTVIPPAPREMQLIEASDSNTVPIDYTGIGTLAVPMPVSRSLSRESDDIEILSRLDTIIQQLKILTNTHDNPIE